MDPQYLTCSLCGFEFDKADTVCAHGCPLGAMCALVRCPACGYEYPETPRAVSWMAKLFRRRAAGPALPEGIMPLSEMKGGGRAEVMCLGSTRTPRHTRLGVFGLVPGAVVRVIQQCPACVIKVGETELALDPEIPRGVLVRPTATPQ